ncbi:ABC transporter ATP-binding protein [Reyranella sp.]|jgi:branched-chain amino acid transport system ATP-binding protein|uniref:ABC transporter ATP-binding protein n=1 Tax=Reyranella sp. TaxID=1929291 RepID=UPI001201E763|nr:ABC transporter ATP-binding protein [Reyranella sp.]TAJ89272.1 MAG: ABC transporter ATP-binding protein [Reyranella sp.]
MLLEARHLHIGYGDAPAVWDVSFDVDAGEIVSVIGPNGAGKTTLINAIAGLLRCRQGELRFDGADMTKVRAHDYCGHGIALVPEGRRLFTKMTVEENLELGCYLPSARAARASSLERVYGLFPILRDKRQQPAGELSGGQQQMVAIGRALMARPRIVLFDEPSLGLAPTIVDDMFDIISRVRDDGAAVLLVEQNVLKALSIADRAYVLEQGRIVATGLPDELLKQPHIREAYLGV